MKTETSQKQEMTNKTWGELFRKYKPEITDKEIEFILWNETCYPFDDPTAVKQVIAYFTSN